MRKNVNRTVNNLSTKKNDAKHSKINRKELLIQNTKFILAIIAIIIAIIALVFGKSKMIITQNKGNVPLTFNILNYQIITEGEQGEEPAIDYACTLAQAIQKAPTGSTIKVLADTTESTVANIPADKTITLNMNGKTIELTNSLSNYGTLTLTGEGEITSEEADTIVNYGTYAQQDAVKVSNTGTVLSRYSALVNSGEMTITGGEVEATNYAIKQLEEATLVVTRNTANNDEDVVGPNITSNKSVAIYAEKGTVTIGTNETPTTVINEENPVIKGKTYGIEAKSVVTLNYYDGIIIGQNGKGSAVEYPGTINKIPGKQIEKSITIERIDNEDVEIETTKLITAEYVEYDKTTGNVVAYYETLNKALNSADNENTVKPLENIDSEGAVTVRSDKNVILDMDGKNITLTGTLTNQGTLAIVGTGTLTGNANTLISNEGTLSIGIQNNPNGVSTVNPQIIGTQTTIENKSGATLNIYEGSLKVVDGTGNKVIDGTVSQVPQGYTLKETTETVEQTTYKVLTLVQSYTVSFNKNANDATGTMANQTIEVNQAANLTTNAYTRTGYIFTGWNTAANGTGTGYINGQEVTNLSNVGGVTVVLYAQWVEYSASNLLQVNPSGSTAAAKSPYVNYVDANGTTRLCRVLYNDTTHGLQIITNGSVETVTLGEEDPNYTTGTDIENAQNSYNNLVVDLNNKAESYNNNTYSSDARCIGSTATVTNGMMANKDEEELLTNPNNYSYLDTYVTQGFKGTDTHYGADSTQMYSLGIGNIGDIYWLASRDVYSISDVSYFGGRTVDSYGAGDVSSSNLWYVEYDGYTKSYLYGRSNGFRPVFLLKSNVIIIGGSGTETDPYTLGTVDMLELDNQSATTPGTEVVYYTQNTATYYSDQAKTTTISSITIPTKTDYIFGGYYTQPNGQGTQYITAAGQFTGNPYTLGGYTKLYAYWGDTEMVFDDPFLYEDTKARYHATHTIPQGFTAIESGWIWMKENTENITDDNAKITLINSGNYKKLDNPASSESWLSVTPVNDQTIWMMVYLTVEKDGVQTTVYSTAKSAKVSELQNKTLTYNANGHGTAPANVTQTYADATNAAAAITAEGYLFTGWNTAADGSGTSYAAGEQIKAANTLPSEMTLYAQWIKVTPVSEITSSQYGQYVNLGTNILDLNNVTLSDDTHPQADWRVFRKDANGVWLILSDYMPNTSFDVSTVGLQVSSDATYGVNSNANRKILINGLKGISLGKSNWNGLIAGSDLYDSNNNLINSNIKVQGAIDLDTWVASWNEKYTPTLYTATTASEMYDGLNGYYVGDKENPGTVQYKISSSSKTLFFPHTSIVSNCTGYWLASPSAYHDQRVMNVYYSGYVFNGDYGYTTYGVRPAVYLPNEIKLDMSNSVWTIAE